MKSNCFYVCEEDIPLSLQKLKGLKQFLMSYKFDNKTQGLRDLSAKKSPFINKNKSKKSLSPLSKVSSKPLLQKSPIHKYIFQKQEINSFLLRNQEWLSQKNFKLSKKLLQKQYQDNQYTFIPTINKKQRKRNKENIAF